MVRLEIEVKIRIGDASDVPRRLEKAGGRLLHARELEDNHLYDFPDQILRRRGEVLRVRFLERGVILTFKGPGRVESGKKVREETETVLAASEGEPLSETIAKLGLVETFRYQKYRTTWSIRGLHVTLDETPIGSFLELEGDATTIDEVTGLLGFTTADHIVASYHDLFLKDRGDRPDKARGMIF